MTSWVQNFEPISERSFVRQRETCIRVRRWEQWGIYVILGAYFINQF